MELSGGNISGIIRYTGKWSCHGKYSGIKDIAVVMGKNVGNNSIFWGKGRGGNPEKLRDSELATHSKYYDGC